MRNGRRGRGKRRANRNKDGSKIRRSTKRILSIIRDRESSQRRGQVNKLTIRIESQTRDRRHKNSKKGIKFTIQVISKHSRSQNAKLNTKQRAKRVILSHGRGIRSQRNLGRRVKHVERPSIKRPNQSIGRIIGKEIIIPRVYQCILLSRHYSQFDKARGGKDPCHCVNHQEGSLRFEGS